MRLHRSLLCCLATSLALAGCGSEGAQEGTGGDTEAVETAGCAEALLEEGADTGELAATREELAELPLVEALDAVPSLQQAGSSMRSHGGDLLGDAEGLTLFAPLDEAFLTDVRDPEDTDTQAPQGSSYTAFPADAVLSAHLAPGIVANVEELAREPAIDLADGTTADVSETGDTYTVQRRDVTAAIVCDDVETADGIVHVIDAVLFQPDVDLTDPQEPNTEPGPGVSEPETPTDLDEHIEESELDPEPSEPAS